jgi:hypothetical protein
MVLCFFDLAERRSDVRPTAIDPGEERPMVFPCARQTEMRIIVFDGAVSGQKVTAAGCTEDRRFGLS